MNAKVLALAVTLAVAACVSDVPPVPEPPAGLVGRWYDERGRPVAQGLDGEPLVLHVFNGHPHCNWEEVVFLHLAWPPGRETRRLTGERLRQYVRDPEGLVEDRLSRGLDTSATLPEDARFAGYRRGEWELWISPRDADAFVYLVGSDRTERWPRTALLRACG